MILGVDYCVLIGFDNIELMVMESKVDRRVIDICEIAKYD